MLETVEILSFGVGHECWLIGVEEKLGVLEEIAWVVRTEANGDVKEVVGGCLEICIGRVIAEIPGSELTTTDSTVVEQLEHRR